MITVRRYLNDVPISKEALHAKKITNDTITRIFTNVKKRVKNNNTAAS